KMLTYHITGLAIRGYDKTCKQWKPEKNEVLECSCEGAVVVMKGKVNCGSVPTDIQEESKKFILAGGSIKAEVIDINPRYRGKGKEIPCIYIWSGLNNQLIKDAGKAAKLAVAKARKVFGDDGIKFEQQKIPPEEKPGTSSGNRPAKSSKKENEKKMLTYHITGLAIRGFDKTCKQWKPEKNEVLECSCEGAVVVMKGKVNCGSVPTDIQEESKRFILAGGIIKAEVIDINPRYRGKGKEIPCIYIWSGLNNQLIKDAAKAAKLAVTKARKVFGDDGIKFEQQKIPQEVK
ncbi:uncharacterized protein LOC132715085, partial [Ruditapes philippinarum]|uniref:uncharacterized protein LOC132715085 n=1 Tax=Ruditapes philippinarum TaxID=129788 RepID=UPI00295BD6B7